VTELHVNDLKPDETLAGLLERSQEKPVTYRPLGDNIIVRRLDADEKIGSLYIPEKAREKPIIAEVVAAGPKTDPAIIPGARVYFAKYSGSELKLNGEDHLIIRDEDVLAVLE
jgi:chaperonin GroES